MYWKVSVRIVDLSNCTLMFVINGISSELQKRADRADQSVLFFLAGANFLGKAREKLLIFGKSTRKTANFLGGGKLVGANFYAFCNYAYL